MPHTLDTNDRDPELKVFKGTDDQWYWSFHDTNGKIVSTGGEGFHDKDAAIHGAQQGSPVFLTDTRTRTMEYFDWETQTVETGRFTLID